MWIIKNRNGDTIIEVMLALAVLGAVIAGGYAIATRSLNGIQLSQERSEATKIAEGQIETIKAYFAANNFEYLEEDFTGSFGGADRQDDPSYLPDRPFGTNSTWDVFLSPPINDTFFCAKDDGSFVRFDSPGDPANFSIASYPAVCTVGRYRIYVDTDFRDINPASVNLYAAASLQSRIRITWERSGGGDPETLVFYERLFL